MRATTSCLVLLVALTCHQAASQVATGGVINVTSLSLNPGPNEQATVFLGKTFSVGMQPNTGAFQLSYLNSPSIVVSSDGNVDVYGKIQTAGVTLSGNLAFMGVNQWLLAAAEDFTNQGAPGWSNSSTSSCGNEAKKMLGGYNKFAGGEVKKTYQLPPHNAIRLHANYHFIDAWSGETAYAKIDYKIVWTESYDQVTTKTGIQICGSAVPENKFTVPIDIVYPHKCTDSCPLTISFGSTLTLTAAEQSWGVDDVMIFVR